MAGYEWRPGGEPVFTFETKADLERFVRERVWGDYVFTSAEVRDAWVAQNSRRPPNRSGRPSMPLPPGTFYKPAKVVVKSTTGSAFVPLINT